MLKSMTGYGRGECTHNDRKFRIELKSVNHRFSDYTIKVPRFLNPFEDRIRRRLMKAIVRGKVDVWASFESFTPEDITVQVNTVYADAYMDAFLKLSTRYSLGDVPIDKVLDLLAKLPDVIVSDRFENAMSSDTVKDEIWEGISDALEQAIIQYNKMRETEGRALANDISEKYVAACGIVKGIRERVPQAMDESEKRLRERIGGLVKSFGTQADQGRLLTEIAVLADKSDINEEMTRLESHFEQLSSMLVEGGAIGRKMDFLMQELNREANTIGSKSSDILLTKFVVELKSVVEKMREQIQNIE
ncbi:MAG: YicC family protein [Defluviitaleaceae bacterium]|nr:YicC family protein [Defluviitaleaceae bacterium]